jgi:hypothetical protein
MKKHTDRPTQAETIPNSDKPESIVIAQRFILTDSEGRERVQLYTDKGLALLSFLDKENDPRFSIAVSLDGFVLMSATHRLEDDKLDACFQLVISSGEPEMIMKDAIFNGTSVMTARGFFNSE